MTEQNKTNPLAFWVIALGAGAAGVSGVGNMGQLSSLNTAMEEQIRIAEMRGHFQAEIASIRQTLMLHEAQLRNMIDRDGVMELHRAQQSLIDKLIDFSSETVTKNELQLAIGKMREISKGEQR